VSAQDAGAVEAENENDAELCRTRNQGRAPRLRAAVFVNANKNMAKAGEYLWRSVEV
jgi:hypothetical protein